MLHAAAPMAPPHSLEAEESVIGGALVHPRKLGDVIAVARPDDFYHPALRAVYEAMVALEAASRPVDPVTVLEQMRSLDTLDKLRANGGADYLTELQAKVVTVENLGYHARLVRSKAKRRRMEEAFRSLAAAARADSADDDYFADAEQRMLELAADRGDSDLTPKNFTAVMHEYYKLLEKRYAMRAETGKGVITGLSTGYDDMDRLTCGLQDGDMVLIAGRPSMGKTSIAMNMAINAALADRPVLVFSLEMSNEQLAERALSGEARIDSQRLRHGDLEAKHWLRLSAASSRLAGRRLEVLDRGSVTIAEIRSVARAWRLQHRVVNAETGEREKGLVVIDYLQLVSASRARGRRDNGREREVSEISQGIKQLAKDLKCPVVALAQLNRGLESRPDKRPLLSDLRDSGSLEQDADLVAFVYRDEVYSKDECKPEDKGVAELIIRKQRMGPTATVRLAFLDAFTKFETLSTRSH